MEQMTQPVQSISLPPSKPVKSNLTSAVGPLRHIIRHANETTHVKIENCIGFTQVPVGLAGPLDIHGHFQQGTYFGPLATTEPTLVASCSRGCKAFQAGGGIKAMAISDRLARAPVFRFQSVDDAVSFFQIIPDLEAQFRADAEMTSRHARLVSVVPHIIGKSVHVRFDYSCGDASGQNMTTIATHRACEKLFSSALGQKLGVIDFQLEGNMSGDKKLAWGNVRDGRGVKVLAWGTISDETCKKVLGASAAQIHRAICTLTEGGIRNGQSGVNVNTANVIAAMFISCGQDAASVLEGGWSHLTSEYDYDTRDLTLSLFIPALPIGTVGGGTMYPTQKEALEMIGCSGDGKKFALGETIAAFALALDVSTISALANDTFSQSHQRLARGSKL